MKKIELEGQWFGFYSYSEEYGETLSGEKVVMSLLFEKVFNNKFTGKCIELSGVGASEEISQIEGFIENDFISFKKEYQTYYQFEEDGTIKKIEDSGTHELSYEGVYDFDTKAFSGIWEIWFNERAHGEYNYVRIGEGTWELSKNSTRYGL
jgi:hypothetical protein